MSAKKITKTVYVCVCDLPDCCGIDKKTGKPRPWETRDDQIPSRCSWCKRRTWNHPDRRLSTNDSGPLIGAQKPATKKAANGRITLPKPTKVRAIE